jgi:hypothetical protein
MRITMSNSDTTDDEKVRQLREIMAKFVEENPVALPIPEKQLPEQKPETDFAIVETSRTLTYTQKG